MADLYKKALFEGVRIMTSKGNLNVSQLVELSINELVEIIISLNKKISDNKSNLDFLGTVSADEKLVFGFNLLKDIYLTKKESQDRAIKSTIDAEHNRKIDALIQEKEENSLKNLSVDELKAMRR